MRQATAIALGIALALGAAAAQAQQNRAEVIHWWTSGGESAAVKELAKAYTAAGGTWVDSAIAGGEAARSTAINRIVGGTPSTAAQFNTSKQFHAGAAHRGQHQHARAARARQQHQRDDGPGARVHLRPSDGRTPLIDLL